MLTIEGLIAVISLCLTAFGLGYAIGSTFSIIVLTLCISYVKEISPTNSQIRCGICKACSRWRDAGMGGCGG